MKVSGTVVVIDDGRTTCCSSKEGEGGGLSMPSYFPLSGASHNRKLSRSGATETTDCVKSTARSPAHCCGWMTNFDLNP